MPKFESLDDLIARKAQEYADQIKAAAAMADKEEEIRIESEKQLAFIQKEAGIKLEGKHEVTVASGRVDSVYSRVIIEYKNPMSSGSFDSFVGEIENETFDGKSQPYPVDLESGKLELSKDVAALANTSGGCIIIGLRTRQSALNYADEVEAVRVVP